MVTASTAPVRRKHNKFTITAVATNAENTMSVSVRVQDEADAVVQESRALYTTTTERTSLVYGPDGEVTEQTSASSPAILLADFNAFATTAGAFAPRAAALEARYVATGRLPP